MRTVLKGLTQIRIVWAGSVKVAGMSEENRPASLALACFCDFAFRTDVQVVVGESNLVGPGSPIATVKDGRSSACLPLGSEVDGYEPA